MSAKILEIGPYPPPRAGWAIRIEYITKELRKQGHICIPLNIGRYRKIKSSKYVTVQNGIDFVSKVFRYSRQGFLIHMHTNGDSPKGFVLALLAESIATLFGKRAVLTFHAGPEQLFFPQSKSKRHVPLFKIIFRLPQKIICNNKEVREQIFEYGVRQDKIVPIPAFSKQYLEINEVSLPPNLEEFIQTRTPFFCTYLMYRKEFYIESVLEAIYQLIQRWPKLGMVIIGAEDARREIKQLVSAYNISEHIYHVGDLSHEAFLMILKRSKLYLRSHARDGVCSSVLEALSLGVPVVASENKIRPQSVVTFEIGNAKDIFEKVSFVLENYEIVQKMVITPDIHDTLQKEIQLLVECYKT